MGRKANIVPRRSRVSTASLVNNPAFRERSRALAVALGGDVPEESPLSTEEIVLGRMNQFYSYFDVVRGIEPNTTRREARVAYENMLKIQQAYPHNSVLMNRMDEAERYLRGKKFLRGGK